jgi:hypothetical protein
VPFDFGRIGYLAGVIEERPPVRAVLRGGPSTSAPEAIRRGMGEERPPLRDLITPAHA